MIRVKGFLIGVLGLLAIFLGCKEEEPKTKETGEVTLSVSDSVLNFSAKGGEQVLKIASNTIWRLKYDNTLWGKATIQTTRGDANVTITAVANDSTEARTMTMTLTAEGADDLSIVLNQEAGEPDPVEPVRPDSIAPDNTEMRNLTSVELSKLMGTGWNLGNSLEAITTNGDTFSGGETSWGNPAVNKELIDAVKAAGFNTVRIPVSWSHMFEGPDGFKISYAWKLRVEEVIKYALDNDMFVIMNIHWDGGWMDHPTYDHQEEINSRLTVMWQQIAVFFRDYDDRLLFAGTNEVHVKDNYGAPTAENAEVQNSFNQTFVNTVRATGGRNVYRHLVVQSYNTNINYAVDYLVIPSDPTPDRLMVEVHFYDPYEFALKEDGDTYLWGTTNQGDSHHAGWGDEAWVDEAFGKMKTNFVDKGYPVIMGEYGAILRANLEGTAYDDHVISRNNYLTYVVQSAISNGMVPVYWDNGYTGNNGFGLFNRLTGEVVYQNALDAATNKGF